MAQSLVFLFFVLAGAAAFAARGASAAMATPASLGKRYVVGGPEGWRSPPRGQKDFYMKWAAGIHFYVEDAIEFVYKNDTVAKVDKYGYYHCNTTAPANTSPLNKDGSSLFLLDAPGPAYFSCVDVKHCKKGQRLMINVDVRPEPSISATPAGAPGPAPEPAPEEPAAARAAARASSSLMLAVSVAAVVMSLMGLIQA